MRREKNSFEKNNLFIYIGAVIFILLAVAIGIIMYIASETGNSGENTQLSQEPQTQDNIEPVTNEFGKTVEEQKTEEKPETGSKVENKTESKTENKSEEKTKDNTVTTSNPTTPVNEPKTETKKEMTFAKPAEGEIICEYAKDNLIYSETLKEWLTHTAIDIKTDKTSVIKSAADGVIKTIVNDPRYGLTVVISHDDGYETVYSNLLTAEFVVVGEEVKQGQTIGTAGNTASFESSMECHLHFELLKDGEYLNPAIYLK